MDEQKDRKAQQGRKGKDKKMTPKPSVPFVIDPTNQKVFIEVIEMGKDGIQTVDMKAKGGRAGFKSGSKGCKLAMKGKGRAYGKNS